MKLGPVPLALLGLAAALAFTGVREAAAQPACTGPESAVRLYVNVENVREARGLKIGRAHV